MREVITLTQKLIRIDSSNPPGKEKKVALFIQDYLKSLKVPVKIYSFKKDRPNVVTELRSLDSKKKLLITAHIDTVPAKKENWKFPPFSGKIFQGKIYGRGATDAKGNVAVILAVIKNLREEKIKLRNLDLIFAFTCDEETGSKYGIFPLLDVLEKIDYGLVLDGSNFEIINSQKGVLHLKVEIFGKSAHGAYPEKGINAIEKAVYILEKILKEKSKNTTVNIGRIQGGEKVNIVADYVFFELDFRYLFPTTGKIIIKRIKNLISPRTKYNLEILAHQEPFYIDKNHFLITTFKEVLKRNRIKIKFSLERAATVVNFLKDRGIDCFCFGFGEKDCAHKENEFIRINSLKKGVRVLKEYIEMLDRRLDEEL